MADVDLATEFANLLLEEINLPEVRLQTSDQPPLRQPARSAMAEAITPTTNAPGGRENVEITKEDINSLWNAIESQIGGGFGVVGTRAELIPTEAANIKVVKALIRDNKDNVSNVYILVRNVGDRYQRLDLSKDGNVTVNFGVESFPDAIGLAAEFIGSPNRDRVIVNAETVRGGVRTNLSQVEPEIIDKLLDDIYSRKPVTLDDLAKAEIELQKKKEEEKKQEVGGNDEGEDFNRPAFERKGGQMPLPPQPIGDLSGSQQEWVGIGSANIAGVLEDDAFSDESTVSLYQRLDQILADRVSKGVFTQAVLNPIEK